ncbi:hypothetical protein [Streptomyces sp. NPDC005799]|uniref:hypothetical protein n=1 Tax=Streptomyces sp. NPDC005799 TaxID=3154678 RepID=UPI0033EECA80
MQQLHAAPTTRVRMADSAYYYDLDPQRSGPLKGKEWMRIDTSAPFGEKGAQAISGAGSGGTRPTHCRTFRSGSTISPSR